MLLSSWLDLPLAVCGPSLTACEHNGRRAQAAAFVKGKLVDGGTGRLRRSFRLNASEAGGYADDYAHLIEGLLDLFQVRPLPSCPSLLHSP